MKWEGKREMGGMGRRRVTEIRKGGKWIKNVRGKKVWLIFNTGQCT